MDKFVICAGDRESPEGLRIVPTRAVQYADYVRAEFGEQFDRGILRHEISFQVHHLLADARAAMAFNLDRAARIPGRGILSLEFTDGTSGGISRWIRNAVTLRAECVQVIGITAVWAYSFVGGEILTRNPATNPTVGLIN